MTVTPTSYAATSAAYVNNVQFQAEAQNVSRKQLLIGSYDTSKTVTDNVPVQVFSADEVGDTYGFGSMLHRMSVQAFLGNQSMETWVLPAPEAGTAVQSTGTITVTGPATAAGTYSLYIAGISVPVDVAKADTATEVGDAIVAAIVDDGTLPVTAANVTGTVTLTAVSGGTWGDDISITENWGVGEDYPAGISTVIVAMASGANDPDIDDALAGLGSGDLANEEFFTDVNVGWGSTDTTTLDAIANYVGQGNTRTGLYSETVARPFRVLHGDTVADTAGLTAILAVANARKLDRANGTISAPGSPAHPVELACLALGVAARLNNTRPEETALDQVLTGVIPGDRSDMWTSEYANRDTAVKDGVSTTLVKSGVLTIQNLLTFYHPDSVPLANNGYRSMRNISINQNVLYNVKARFETQKWQGVSIVADTATVGDATAKAKARDIKAVIDDLLALTESFRNKAWIYTDSFTKERISAGGLVTIRAGANGFDATLPILLSGEAGIFNNQIQFDTSLSIVL